MASLGSQHELIEAPGRVAVDGASNLYLTDPASGRVIVRNQLGRLVAVKDGLDRPLGIAVDSLGAIYVSELGSGRVSVFDSSWTLLDKLGSGDGEFLTPNDIAVDSFDGSILVSDGDAHVVKVYNSAGALLRTIGSRGAAAGEFEFPAAVHVTGAGEVFVADQNNDRVQVFDRDGTFLRCFGQQPGESRKFGRTAGLTSDSVGRIYVTDGFQGLVQVFDDQGVGLATLGVFGPDPAGLMTPLGLAIDASNRLFVTSHNTGAIQVFGIDSFSDPRETEPAGSLQFDSATFDVGEAGGTASVTITRTGGSTGLVMAAVQTADGTATSGGDYQPVMATVIFADGDTAPRSVTIPIADDARHEGDETVDLALVGPLGGAVIGSPQNAVLTLLDDDPPAPGSLQFDTPSYAGVERGGSLLATISRSVGSDGTVTVDAVASGGSAEAGLDFSAPAATITFLDGDVEPKSFAITFYDDAVYEGDETLQLALSLPTGGATIGATGSAVVTILEDEPAPPACPSELTLANHVVVAAEDFAASDMITAGNSFRVASPAGAASLRAGSQVSFVDGFVVDSGATVTVIIDPAACGGGG
ncbi:MAG: Calx-beta domain-containing protein [Thermoanaerobaculia bacterium]